MIRVRRKRNEERIPEDQLPRGTEFRKYSRLNSKEVSRILDCCPDDVPMLAKSGCIIGAKTPNGKRWWYDRRSVVSYKMKLDRMAGRASTTEDYDDGSDDTDAL